jgi:hypothetical protein
MKNLATTASELMNELLSPDEERAVMNWVAARPPEELKATTQGFPAPAHAVFRSLQDLREKKVDPATPEVQALIDEWNQIVVRCQVPNRRAAGARRRNSNSVCRFRSVRWARARPSSPSRSSRCLTTLSSESAAPGLA